MALTSGITWRARPGGNNANGGGFDASTSGALSTTLAASLTAGATTMQVASASGWPSSGNFYVQLGAAGAEPAGGGSEIVLVTAGQGTTTWTITRGQLGTTALAFASGIAVSNDLSRCTTAPWSGTTGTSNNSTAWTDAGASYNATAVGNILYLASGTNGTVGAYLIVGYVSPTALTLDRACSTAAMTNGTYKIGGAWADPATRGSGIVAGNTVFIRGSGSATVASPDYATVGYPNYTNGDSTNGTTKIIGENGRPVMKTTNPTFIYSATAIYIENLYIYANAGSGSGVYVMYGAGSCKNIIVDQGGRDITGFNWSGSLIQCEVFSSTANVGAAGAGSGVSVTSFGCQMIGCNVHDCWGIGITTLNNGPTTLSQTIVAKNKGTGIIVNGGIQTMNSFNFCTIDGNGGDGISFSDALSLSATSIFGCIISNNTGAGKYGIKTASGTQAANDRLRALIGNNWFYNNTANALNLSVGSAYGDSVGVDPGFVAQGTEGYAITGAAKAWLQYTIPQSKSGQGPTISYPNAGAIMGDPSATVVVNRVNNLFVVDGDSAYVP